jgi:antitoxin component YwqK of YwqJK toxin-antitoxin module
VQRQLLHLSRLKNISSNYHPTFLKLCTFNVATALARETLAVIAMKIVNYTILFFLYASCSTQHKEIISKYENGNPQKERTYKNIEDKDSYYQTLYYENGKVKSKTTIEDGKFIGEKINYYENGNLRQIDSLDKPCELDFCCCDGSVTRFDTNGKLTETFINRNGVENGQVKTYYPNGQLKDSYKMIDGRQNGKGLRFYSNGKLNYITEQRNDTLIGFSYFFDENGDSLKYTNHTNGEIDFPLKKWLKNGVTLSGNYLDLSKDKVRWQWFDSLGRLIKSRIDTETKDGFITPE